MSKVIPRVSFRFPWESYNILVGVDSDRFIATTMDGELVMNDITLRIGFGLIVFTFMWELV